MNKVNNEFLQNIETAMFNRALDTDVSLYNLDYSDMPQNYVLISISLYQNKDGGFGHALDFDNVNPLSTAYQTYFALRLIDEAKYTNIKEDELLEEILSKAFNYLYNRATRIKDLWLLKESINDKAACALRFKGPNQESLPLSMGIIGYTLYFLDSNKAYYKMALKLLDKYSKEILSLDSLSLNELYYFKVLLKGLKKIGHKDYDLYLDRYNLLLQKESINYKSDYYSFLDLFESYTDNTDLNDKIDDALDILISSVKPHGMFEAIHSWGTEQIYPESDSAMIKWVGRASRYALHYIKVFERIEK